MRSIIREQRHICGPAYMEVDIYPVTLGEHTASRKQKERAAQRLVQANLNDKNARRYLGQLLATNFNRKDIHITLTYRPEDLPSSPEQAEKYLVNYLRRVRRRCEKLGIPAPKYIAVTEYRIEDGELVCRFHHHIVISCGLSRDELEALWGKGRANADRLQPEQGNFEALAEYLTKYPNRKHRWRRSRGLAEPKRPAPNDSRYSRRTVEKIVRERMSDKDFWRRRYPGYELIDMKAEWNEYTGWHLTGRFWRHERT